MGGQDLINHSNIVRKLPANKSSHLIKTKYKTDGISDFVNSFPSFVKLVLAILLYFLRIYYGLMDTLN